MGITLEALRINHKVQPKFIQTAIKDAQEEIDGSEDTLGKIKGYTLVKYGIPSVPSYALLDKGKVASIMHLENTYWKTVKIPHSIVNPDYAGKGLATEMYKFLLNSGVTLMSGEIQSPEANKMWFRLSQQYDWFLVTYSKPVLGKSKPYVEFLGQSTSPKVLKHDDTRIVLLAKGTSLDKFKHMTKMETQLEARTFSNKGEVKKAAEELIKQLSNSINDYSLNGIDLTIRSSDDLEEVVADFIGLGFKPFKPAAWDVETNLKRSRFMSIGDRFPILVRENPNAWGVTVILLGQVLPKFRELLFAFKNLIDGEPCLSVSTMIPSVQGLQMEFCTRQSAGKNSIISILKECGFHPASGNLLLSRKLGLYVKYSGNSVTVMDSRY